MIKLRNEDCPYGASECPKVTELHKLLIRNSKELDEVKATVITLNTTLRTFSKIISVMLTFLTGLIGVTMI